VSKKEKEYLEKQSEHPVLISVGMLRKNGLYHPFTMKTQGSKVISNKIEDGDMKAIAQETLKINVVRQILDAQEI